MSSLWWLGFLGLLTGLLWALYRQPPEVTIQRQLPPNGFEGTEGAYALCVQVHTRWPTRLVVEERPPRGLVPSQTPVLAGFVWGDWSAQTSTIIKLNKRGHFQWSGATLHWSDPLGLFWRSFPLAQQTWLEVYPGTHPILLPELLRPLLSEGAWARLLGLEDPLSLRGGRAYQSGDSPSRLHWRMSARSGQLMVRELERMAASSVTLYVDTERASEQFVDSAVRLGASLLLEALKLELPVAVAAQGRLTPSGRHQEAHQRALSVLAELKPSEEAPFIPPSRSGGNLFILTTHASPALIEQAMRARATASRVVLLVIPEGFYLEPGEKPRHRFTGLPEPLRDLERQIGVLASQGIVVQILRGHQSLA